MTTIAHWIFFIEYFRITQVYNILPYWTPQRTPCVVLDKYFQMYGGVTSEWRGFEAQPIYYFEKNLCTINKFSILVVQYGYDLSLSHLWQSMGKGGTSLKQKKLSFLC